MRPLSKPDRAKVKASLKKSGVSRPVKGYEGSCGAVRGRPIRLIDLMQFDQKGAPDGGSIEFRVIRA